MSVEGPLEKRAGAAERWARQQAWSRQQQILHVGYFHKTSNTVFLIYDYCVSVTIIAGVCKNIHRELGGRWGLEKPPDRGGGRVLLRLVASPCESDHVTWTLVAD